MLHVVSGDYLRQRARRAGRGRARDVRRGRAVADELSRVEARLSRWPFEETSPRGVGFIPHEEVTARGSIRARSSGARAARHPAARVRRARQLEPRFRGRKRTVEVGDRVGLRAPEGASSTHGFNAAGRWNEGAASTGGRANVKEITEAKRVARDVKERTEAKRVARDAPAGL